MTLRNRHVFIALGGNLPLGGMVPTQTLAQALTALSGRGMAQIAVSRFYATPCFPTGAGPDYVNAAAAFSVPEGMDVLALLHEVEARFGRARSSRWAGRTLDLDLLAEGETVQPDLETWTRWHDLAPADQARLAPDRLILPHPRLQDRAFVLVPLADVAPDWHHPVLQKTVAQMLAALPLAEIQAVRPL
jgi:2-amino-4-hydroxy-6-hydroxymethyldihydropteridine diphosphokinase